MRYIIDKKKFEMRLREMGYKSMLDFARRFGIHRNTLLLYLKGKDVFSSSFARITEALKIDPAEIMMPISDKKIKIDAIDEIRPIIALIIKHDPNIAVFLLGSRAKGKKREHADWDIGITRGRKPIDGNEYLKLRMMVNDAAEDLLHNVDIVNLDRAPAWFLEGIDYEPVFLDGDRESFSYFKGVIDGIKKLKAA